MNICETYSGNNVPKRTKWIYSTVATFRDACYALVSMFLITFIQYSGVLTRGLPASATSEEKTALFVATFGVITALVIGYRIFDALNDPFMGVIIEKTHFVKSLFSNTDEIVIKFSQIKKMGEDVILIDIS